MSPARRWRRRTRASYTSSAYCASMASMVSGSVTGFATMAVPSCPESFQPGAEAGRRRLRSSGSTYRVATASTTGLINEFSRPASVVHKIRDRSGGTVVTGGNS